jgi:hypothetical protein
MAWICGKALPILLEKQAGYTQFNTATGRRIIFMHTRLGGMAAALGRYQCMVTTAQRLGELHDFRVVTLFYLSSILQVLNFPGMADEFKPIATPIQKLCLSTITDRHFHSND